MRLKREEQLALILDFNPDNKLDDLTVAMEYRARGGKARCEVRDVRWARNRLRDGTITRAAVEAKTASLSRQPLQQAQRPVPPGHAKQGVNEQPDSAFDVMATGCILSDYLECAMSSATFDKLGDGSFAGKVPPCQGVVALGKTLTQCQRQLRSTLEDWLLVGLRMGHAMPVLSG